MAEIGALMGERAQRNVDEAKRAALQHATCQSEDDHNSSRSEGDAICCDGHGRHCGNVQGVELVIGLVTTRLGYTL